MIETIQKYNNKTCGGAPPPLKFKNQKKWQTSVKIAKLLLKTELSYVLPDKRLEAAGEELLTTATTTNDDSPVAIVFDCEEGGKKCTFSCSKSIPLIEGDEVLIICCTCAAKKEAGAVLRTAPPSDATIIHAAEASPTPPILVTTTCTAGLCIEQFNHEGPEKFVVQTNGTLRDLQRVLIDGDSQTKMKGKGCRLFASPTFPFNVCFEYFSV